MLVPAHNEEQGIAKTVSLLVSQLQANDFVLVIADNCTDATARIAREAGARVVERNDPSRRGKGYALAFGVKSLVDSAPDVVVIVDADCEIAPGGLEQLATLCAAADRPVQADYVMVVPPDASVGARVSAFAFRVRNRLRPRGLAAVGMPCHLAGTGMAFPWEVLRDAPALDGHITEDLMLGLELSLRGKAPIYCRSAHVVSDLAKTSAGQDTQRERWEHGHLSLIRSHLPRLLGGAVAKGKPELLATALDLCVPPLVLLGLGVGAAGATSLLGVAFGVVGPALLAGVEAGAFVGAIGLAWKAEGSDLLSARDLTYAPYYVLRKIPSYVRVLLGRAEQQWRRTER